MLDLDATILSPLRGYVTDMCHSDVVNLSDLLFK